MRLTAFFKLYKICILLHRCNLNILAKNRFEKSAIFVKFQPKFANFAKSANFCQISKLQLENLIDLKKCYKTRIYLQKSAPIQPKTSELLPKICQNLATTLRVHSPAPRGRERVGVTQALTALHAARYAVRPVAPPRPKITFFSKIF